MPLVRGDQGIAVAFESTWLHVSIQDAADEAGYQGWWLADELVAGISLYLRNCYRKNVIDLPELESVVRSALRNIGYDEVAAKFRAGTPTQGISLVQCLRDAPTVDRSAFFEHLSGTIARLYEKKAKHFHFYDLRACVEQLKSSPDTDRVSSPASLRRKIIAFVREQIDSQGWNHQVWCSIS